MSHVAPTSHRRATRASHRGHRRADRAGRGSTTRTAGDDTGYGISEEEPEELTAGPIQTSAWLGLTFAFIVGVLLTARSHVGLHAAGVTLQVMLVPITVGVFVTAFRQGFGSVKASLTTAAALAFVLLKFFL